MLTHYNVDEISSVGYRVSAKRAVRFRQSATRTLRERLVSRDALNQRWLAEPGLRDVRETLDLLARTLRGQALTLDVDEVTY